MKDIVQAIFLGIEKNVTRRTYFLTDGNVYKSRAFSDLIQKELGNPFVLHLKCPLIVLKVISLLAEFIATRSGKSSTLNSDKYKIMKQRNWQCDIIRQLMNWDMRPNMIWKRESMKPLPGIKTKDGFRLI